MSQALRETCCRTRRGREGAWVLLILALCVGSVGCASLTNPVADGVPVRLIPPELLALSQGDDHTIPLTMLGQPRPKAYLLAPGDVLGVYIDGFLGDRAQPMPLHVAPPVEVPQQRRLPPAAGYPVTVEENGTIALPLAGRLRVAGMTIGQARDAIHTFYVQKQLIKPDQDRLLVTLLHARRYQVLVLRQEASGFTSGPDGVIPSTKRGTGYLLDLPAYENDVLHALTLSGGLPGLDACNAVIVQRGCFRDDLERMVLQQQLEALPPHANPLDVTGSVGKVIRIPLRLPPGEKPHLRPEDVILWPGDVVFLEARDQQYFYTAGLLPPGEHVLPRDRDLDVLQAVALVRGPLINGAFGGSNLSGTLIQPGIGNPSPSLLTVVRRTPGGGQVPIVVDLRCALNDARERILVQPGDLLILQEKPGEAMARYMTQTFFNFNLVWQVIHERFATGVVDISSPDRLPGRLGQVNILTP